MATVCGCLCMCSCVSVPSQLNQPHICNAKKEEDSTISCLPCLIAEYITCQHPPPPPPLPPSSQPPTPPRVLLCRVVDSAVGSCRSLSCCIGSSP